MALGAGKYDDIATMARELCLAEGVALIVIGGAKGSGFSVQAPGAMHAALPRMLRLMADDIEADLTAPAGKAH